MKRTTLIAVLTGAAVLLAGCGSKSGTAAPATSAAPAQSSAPAAASSQAVAPVSSAPDSSAPDSSAPDSSAPDSSAPDSSAPDSSAPDSSAPDSGSVISSGPATTIGGSSAGLDEASTKWFDTFCTGFASFTDLESMGTTLSSEKDPKAAQTKIVDLFNKIGGTFTSTAGSLKDLPPPTFNGGPAFAGKIIPVMTQLGSALTEAAKKAAAVDVTKDPSGLATALSGVSGSMSGVTSSLGDLQNLKITPQTQAAIEAIPSCKKLGSLG